MVANTWSDNTVPTREGRAPVQKAPHRLGIPSGVMTGEPRASARTSSVAALAAALCVCAAFPAMAGPLGNLFGGHPRDGRESAAPPIARYVSEDGDVFTLDRTGPKPLLKFESSFEV